MTFVAITLLPIALLVAVFVALNLVAVAVYQFFYRKSLHAVSKRETTGIVPTVIPIMVIGWWLVGLFANGLSVVSDASHYWVWWQPIDALIVFGVGVKIARWNRARLIARTSLQP